MNYCEGTAARVLVVDGDPGALRRVGVALEHVGFDVWALSSPRAALATVRTRGLPHLAVVDLGMPDMSGEALAGALQRHGDVPVIVTTACHDSEGRIEALERFADDYLVKPFEPRELAVRARRLLARTGVRPQPPGPTWRIDGRLAIDLPAGRLVVEGRAVPLTRIESRILDVLVARAGEPVHREVLLRRVWSGGEAGGEGLRVHLHRLRGKLGGKGADYIETLRGEGYRFKAFPAPAAG